MDLRLTLSPQVSTRMELEPFEKEALESAIDFWTTKPHHTLTGNLSELQKIIRGSETAPMISDQSVSPDARLFEQDFVFVSPEEMQKLDPEEKVGVLMGESVFISEDTPEDYVPMVALNLAFLRAIRNRPEIQEIFGDVAPETSDHWSATLIDIISAENTFKSGSREFKEFMRWRKQVERTDFFENTIIGEILEKRLNERREKMELPENRSAFVKQSWALSGMIDAPVDGLRSYIQENFQELWISRYHVLFRNIVGEENFDPHAMLELLDIVENGHNEYHLAREDRPGRTSKCKKLILKSDDKDRDIRLNSQAYLLTPDVSHKSAVLVQNGLPHDEYFMNEGKVKTVVKNLALLIKAHFKDELQRIESKVGSDVFNALKTANNLKIVGEGGIEINFDLNDVGGSKRAMQVKAKMVQGEMAQIEDALKSYDDLTARFRTLSEDTDLVPASLQEKRNQLLEIQGKLQIRYNVLTSDILDQTLELHSRLNSLIKAIGTDN